MLETVTTRSEIRNAPHRAEIIATILPGKVQGEISPYPTVVSVITISHKALKYESIIEFEPLSSDCILKYGSSNILKTYARIKIVLVKSIKTVHSGFTII